MHLELMVFVACPHGKGNAVVLNGVVQVIPDRCRPSQDKERCFEPRVLFRMLLASRMHCLFAAAGKGGVHFADVIRESISAAMQCQEYRSQAKCIPLLCCVAQIYRIFSKTKRFICTAIKSSIFFWMAVL